MRATLSATCSRKSNARITPTELSGRSSGCGSVATMPTSGNAASDTIRSSQSGVMRIVSLFSVTT